MTQQHVADIDQLYIVLMEKRSSTESIGTQLRRPS